MIRNFIYFQPLSVVITTILMTAATGGRVKTCPLGQHIAQDHINEAFERAQSSKKDLEDMEKRIRERGFHTKPNSASHLHYLLSRENSDSMKQSRDMGHLQLEMIKHFKNRTGLSYDKIFEKLNLEAAGGILGHKFCPKVPICRESKYRSIDGSCNNLQHPPWGKSLTAYKRFLPPEYDDGVDSPRNTGIDGDRLPSARLISTTISPNINRPGKKLNLFGNLFGQFIAHDITGAASFSDIDCCEDGVLTKSDMQHPDCFSIPIPQNDYFYSQYGQHCMPFIRTSPVPRDCAFGPREQINKVTSFLDGSAVYGSTEDRANDLRSFKEGQLRSSPTAGKYVLPPDNEDRSNLRDGEAPVFKAGDGRVNENLLLTIHQMLWFREHNRIAGRLASMNPEWNDETLYHEARRITVAQLQHIAFNEYMPAILGHQTMKKYELKVQTSGYSNYYDESVNPTIANSFGTAAFRFGHTLVQGWYNLANKDRQRIGYMELAKQYNRPIILYDEEKLEEFIRGTITEPIQSFDRYFTDGLTNHLFQPFNDSFGMDLFAINIQRGRDHGTPSYRKWRKFCGLTDFTSFDDLYQIMSVNSVALLQQLYSNSDDVDLYAGMFSENTDRGKILSPTVHCMIGKQLKDLKAGDRFWYENGGYSHSFTEEQLNEIRKVTLSRIICDNTHIRFMQPHSILLPNAGNRLQPCLGESIPRMNLELWSTQAGYYP